jgi:aldehyde:ferredoxin oxidoreductase
MSDDKQRSGPAPSVPLTAPPPSAFPGGYAGKILRVNLTNETIADEVLSQQLCRRYIGGAGFVAYFLWKELKAGVDPLGPDNKLIFALGPVTGLTLPGASRHCIGAKSPLTGGIAKSEVGGFWMVQLKRAGYDAIIIEGKAEKPVYVWVQDGKASIRDAGHLWGKETKETESAIRSELHDEHVHVAMIGRAGENQVLFACIMEGCHDAAGRGGLGAVMGAKNLKAVAVRGHSLPPSADSEKVKQLTREMMGRKIPPLSEFGTGGPDMIAGEAIGNLPVRNFRDGLFPEVQQINGAVIRDTIRVGMEGCFGCPIRCKKIVKFEEPYAVDADYGGPEYETLASLGSNCGIGNLKAIAKANERCNAYGLDTISTGGVIGFAMECFERELLTPRDTGGINLRFGNDEAMLQAVELIANRQGIGNLMAEGTARMSKRIGAESQAFAMHSKGLEPGLHEPRIRPALALAYMLSAIGADHCSSIRDFEFASEAMPALKGYHPLGFLEPVPLDDFGPRKVELYRIGNFISILNDSIAFCIFPGFSLETLTELLKAVTGWDTGMPELLRVGERIVTLMRLFNIREGFTAADDVLPERYFQPKTDGVLADISIDRKKHEKAKQYYYALMGWDANGIPLPEKVEGLCID